VGMLLTELARLANCDALIGEPAAADIDAI
jgi:hypothetical protein